MSPLNPKKILLVKHGSLGDIVFALEPILSIHKKFNNSVIDIVTEEKFIPFFKKIKMFNQFLIDNRKGFLSSFSLIHKIINGKYDLIIDLQNSKRTNFLSFFLSKYFLIHRSMDQEALYMIDILYLFKEKKALHRVYIIS